MRQVLTIICLCLLSFNAWANPVISTKSGTLSSGNAVTITGSGFGTSGGAPALWDNFESGTPDQVISGDWTVYNVDVNESGVPPIYTNTNQRTNSTLCMRDNWGIAEGRYRGEVWFYDSGVTRTELYCTFWVRMSIDSVPAGGNVKWFSFNNDVIGHSPIEPWYFSDFLTNGSVVAYKSAIRDENGKSTGAYHTRPTEDTWVRMEFYVKESSAPDGVFDGTKDGKFWLYMQEGGEGNTFTEEIFYSGVTTNCVGCSGHFIAAPIFFEYWNPAAPVDVVTHVDDVYFSYTQARVEIGDNQVWANCTHREIQIPTVWADGSITFTVNQGSFSNGNKGYIFAVDGSGLSNYASGEEVTFGQTYGGGSSSAQKSCTLGGGSNISATLGGGSNLSVTFGN